MSAWEHVFAYARQGKVRRELPIIEGPSVAAALPLPMPTQRYIFEMGKAGYEFCGSYPEGDDFIIVMKRQRDREALEGPLVEEPKKTPRITSLA